METLIIRTRYGHLITDHPRKYTALSPSLLAKLEPLVHAGVEGDPPGVLVLRLVAVDADDGGVGPRGHVQGDDAAAAPSVQQAVAGLHQQPVRHAPDVDELIIQSQSYYRGANKGLYV